MRKRLAGTQGLTLLEVLTVVAILCLILTIAVPSVWMIGRTLEFQKRNNYARTIFLAAQRELVHLRSNGKLALLPGEANVVRQTGDPEETPPAGYVYAHSGSGAFDWILPEGTVEDTLRDQQILIEYHPESGSVYAVFYYEGGEDLAEQYGSGSLSRQEEQRKKQLVGYYGGSSLSDQGLGIYHVEADLQYHNGQAGVVTVAVPVQAEISGEYWNFMGDNYYAFAKGLEITLTVTGERGGAFTKVIKPYGDTDNWAMGIGPGGVNAIVVSCTLDSLWAFGSFANLPENGEGANRIAPGDNVSLAAEVTFRPGLGDPLVLIESAALAGVNPMFASLTPGTEGSILAISNGRHLQNLNALDPEIAKDVEAVAFFPEQTGKSVEEAVIDWQETVDYYPGLSSFVPIQNGDLFGTAEFLQADGKAPRLQEKNHRDGKENTRIVGNGVQIRNLHIDASLCGSKYPVGLFGYVNTNIDGITLVNPVVRGCAPDGDHATAVGSLVGAAGPDSRISRCGVYIDGATGQFGVSGWGCVGGLVGYLESGKDNPWAVTGCFGAVPVQGEMETDDFCGYRNGVGGLVGNAQMAGFANCYASGTVAATGCTVVTGVAANSAGVMAFGADSAGAGGFVGTSHGCRYTNCFASGDVRGTDTSTGSFAGVLCADSILGSRKTKLADCYGVGAVHNGETSWNFAGAAAIILPTRIPGRMDLQNCYYLSQRVTQADTLAAPVTYEALGSTTTVGLEDWQTAQVTCPYGENLSGETYPFLLPVGFTTYYGSWPEAKGIVAAAYYEIYETGTGYYVDDWDYDTLREEAVLEDGYVLLSAISHIATQIGGTPLELARSAGTVTIGSSAWYVFPLPLDVLSAAAGADFYTKVDCGADTFYINPDVAKGLVCNAGAIPDTVELRSARQLSALGGRHMGQFLHLKFAQKVDISLSDPTNLPIADFSGTYDGGGNQISGLSESLFAENTGTISNLHLQTMDRGNLAKHNHGTIRNCIVTGSGILSVPGLVTVNQGAVEQCTVNAAVAADGSSPMGLLAGQMLGGSIRDCKVFGSITGEGVVGIFAGAAEAGTFVNCHAEGQNSRFPFAGMVAELSSEAIHPDATHYLWERRPDGTTLQAEDFHALAETHRKSRYAATFDNCTFLLNGERKEAIRRQYYYHVESQTGISLAAVDSQNRAIDPGDYMLVSEQGDILHFTEGGSLEWAHPETEIQKGMIWRFDGECWTMDETPSVIMEREESGKLIEVLTDYTIAMRLAFQPENSSALAAYTITATVTTLGTEPTVSQTETQGSERCLLYKVAEQEMYRMVCVDVRDVLTMLE